MGCRGRVLTWWRAPQYGSTPLYIAAFNGHLKVVQALEKAGANKDAPDEVRGGRGGDVGRTNGVRVSFWGLQKGCGLSGPISVGCPSNLPDLVFVSVGTTTTMYLSAPRDTLLTLQKWLLIRFSVRIFNFSSCKQAPRAMGARIQQPI